MKWKNYKYLILQFSNIRSTPLDLLIQDKLCVNEYNQTRDFCRNLPSINTSHPNYHYKSQTLADAVQYNSYQSIIQNVPGIIWALFLGAWIDRYNHGRKAIFIIGSATQCLEALMNLLNAYYFNSDVRWVLLSFVPYILSGAMTGATAYSYVAATTPPHLTAIRMTILETTVALGHLVANLLYGRLINESPPLWSTDQIHNQAVIFMISACSAFLAFIWTLFAINQDKDRQCFYRHFGHKSTVDGRDVTTDEDSSEGEDRNKHSQQSMTTGRALRLLFDWRNVRDVLITAFKPRPVNARAQVWLVIGGIFCYLFVLIGVPSFEFQFYEKIYGWDAQDFSAYESIGLVANCLFVLTFTPIVIRVFKFEDMYLTLIGFCGLMLRMITLGSVLSPNGYYISLAFSCTTWLADVGLRAHLAKLVPTEELGKIFTLLTVVDGVVPPVASSVSAVIFRRTIDDMSGACFYFLAGVCVVAKGLALLSD
ncbi:unnamed protein product [Medioppia subpectinata]|uniref:Adenylate cyclase n=1 Tax=Medioppia subpectinata TaxID=1979941 RepID=A0A7R9KI96_9ACAR|nr:unnamed protein product [Medioppia subpectinata]CAG2103819.1 unnamed protein product [Medioppia subpectinata]